MSLENSVIKVSKKTKASTSITDIEQWTNAFTTYLSDFTDKFPLRSQGLLQYLSLIRYAARVHKGLGWVIYDYKFRQQASKNKSLLWSTIDSQLWLTIFTVHPGVLREEYPLFTKGPSTGSSSSANSKGSYRSGTCNIYNRSGSCTRDTCLYEHICNRCRGAHPGCDCPSLPNPRATWTEAKTTGTLSPAPPVNTSKEQMAPLSTIPYFASVSYRSCAQEAL